jgi:hypothetical protein
MGLITYLIIAGTNCFSKNLVYRIILYVLLNLYSQLFDRLSLVNPYEWNFFAGHNSPRAYVISLKLPHIYGYLCIIVYVVFREFRFAYFDKYGCIVLR